MRAYKVIFTNGCFDCGLTLNHILLLNKAKSLGEYLIVGVNSDDSVKKLKGNHRPILSLEERIGILRELRMVDLVISFDEDTPLELIKIIRPDIIVKGGDYKKEEVVGYGLAEVVVVPKFNYLTTTEKINKIKHI